MSHDMADKGSRQKAENGMINDVFFCCSASDDDIKIIKSSNRSSRSKSTHEARG